MSYRLHYFFFNDTATTEIYTLSLHDALPISPTGRFFLARPPHRMRAATSCGSRRWPRMNGTLCLQALLCGHPSDEWWPPDRKSTRLNSSHSQISYAVFCLQKNTGLHDHQVNG